MFLSFALFYQWISSDKIQMFIVLSFLYPVESIAKNGSQNSAILQDMFVYIPTEIELAAILSPFNLHQSMCVPKAANHKLYIFKQNFKS